MALRRSPSSFLALFGTATLVAGAAPAINAGCPTTGDSCTIILSRNTPGGTLGFLTAQGGQRDGFTTFGIDSTSATETSTVNWMAIPKSTGLAQSTNFTNTASLRRGPSGLQVQKGRATLVAGTKTVTGVPFAPGAIVFVMAADFAGTSGKLSVPDATVNADTGQFVINSNQAADTSTVDWVVISRILRFSPSGAIFSQAKGTLAAGTVEITRMNPLQDLETAVLASVYTPSSPGNLSAPTASRTGGNVSITSSVGGDVSTVELVVF
jgi:hypothetical protein